MGKVLYTVLLISFVIYMIFSPKLAMAALTCTASVSPVESQPNVTEKYFTFTINNTSSSDLIQWFKITRPLSGVTFGPVSLADWEKTISQDAVVFQASPDPLDSNSSLSPTVGVNVGDIAGQSGNWVVQASDYWDGTNPVTCSGTLGFSVSSSATDTTVPSISEITASNITSSSVTINWTTNENANSVVNYGVEYAGPYTSNSSTQTTSHTLTVTDSIAADTTYYYQVCSTDGSGNESCSDENTFTTAAVGTPTPTSTPGPTATPRVITGTPTPTLSPTPTPKPLVDSIAPSILLDTDFSKSFKESTNITGKASDTGDINVGVASVDYSLDDGKNWLPVDTLTGKGQRSATFNFTPTIFEDGNYKVKARAKDSTGNIGYSRTYTLVIDRLPPQVGGGILSIGPQLLQPNKDGIAFALSGLDQKITLSAVGGPTGVDILAKEIKDQRSKIKENSKFKIADKSGNRSTKNAVLGEADSVAEKVFSLVKNVDNGLWHGALSFTKPGIYKLSAKSIDGAQNKTNRELNSIVVLQNGIVKGRGESVKGKDGEKAVKDAIVSLYYFEPMLKQFILWDGKPYSQENPQKTDANGFYTLFVPAGKYYLQISALGYKTVKTNIFTLEQSLPINTDFTLEKSTSFHIGPLNINLPDFRQSNIMVHINYPTLPGDISQNTRLEEMEFPQFSFDSDGKEVTATSIRGKPTIITFLNSWSPQGAEQINILEELTGMQEVRLLAILPQQTNSSALIYKKRGGYNTPIVADPDGLLVLPLNLQTLPQHFFLNRKGIIQKVKTGVLKKEELVENLVN